MAPRLRAAALRRARHATGTFPFDRLLVAQAQSESLVLVTADAAIQPYDVETLPATT